MKYFIAIDSGGNKTESILFDAAGTVHAYARGRGANALDIGPTEASDRICEAADNMKRCLPAGEKVSAVFGSISAAYYYPEIEKRVARHMNTNKCRLDGVVSSVMAAVLGKQEGVCLISGIGAYCCIQKTGEEHRKYVGSTGYMLDTGGSGFALGQMAINAVHRDQDGRGPKTMLTPLIEAEMGESVHHHLPALYNGGRAYIASFAHAVFTARRQGDAVAQQIFDENVNCFAEAMETAYRFFGHPYRAALGGGVFIHVPEYVRAVKERAPEGCELKVIDTPALYGDALQAMWLAGQPIPEDFRSRFLVTYAQQPGIDPNW